MSKKNKFDLTKLVHEGALKEGDTLCFVSDPSKTCRVVKHPSGEFKIEVTDGKNTKMTTVHAYTTELLQQDPPGHASRWLRTQGGRTLYELWQGDGLADAA